MRASMSNAACVRPRRSAFLEIEFTLFLFNSNVAHILHRFRYSVRWVQNNRMSRVHERYRQTTDRLTDDDI